jgi:hypothetical protein
MSQVKHPAVDIRIRSHALLYAEKLEPYSTSQLVGNSFKYPSMKLLSVQTRKLLEILQHLHPFLSSLDLDFLLSLLVLVKLFRKRLGVNESVSAQESKKVAVMRKSRYN